MKRNTKIFYNDSHSYYYSAMILIDSKLKEDDDQLLLIPIIFLLRHSLELAIKAHIVKYLEENTTVVNFNNFKIYDKKGIQLKDKLFATHSIKKLFDCMIFLDKQRLFPVFDYNEIRFMKQSLRHTIRLDDKSDYFRYPIGKSLKLHKRNFIKKYDISMDWCVPELKTREELFISEDNKTVVTTRHFGVMYMQNELTECIELLLSKI